jgi:hypothetical protein
MNQDDYLDHQVGTELENFMGRDQPKKNFYSLEFFY